MNKDTDKYFKFQLVTFEVEHEDGTIEFIDDIVKVWYNQDDKPYRQEQAYPQEYVASAVFMQKRLKAKDYGWKLLNN